MKTFAQRAWDEILYYEYDWPLSVYVSRTGREYIFPDITNLTPEQRKEYDQIGKYAEFIARKLEEAKLRIYAVLMDGDPDNHYRRKATQNNTGDAIVEARKELSQLHTNYIQKHLEMLTEFALKHNLPHRPMMKDE